MRRCAALLLLGAITALLGSPPPPAGAEPAGRSTLDETIGLAPVQGLLAPTPGAGSPFALRTAGLASARADRASSRRSLAFFAQLTDAQLADEMAPARLELLRPTGSLLGLWRPHEALAPQTFDQAVRNVNANALSRVPDADGRRARLGFAIVTGDLSDNHQHNEVKWGVTLLQGGRVDPFSGARIGPANRCPGAPRRVVRRLNAAVAQRRYTGVQDHGDWPGRPASAYDAFYDPDAPRGAFGALPRRVDSPGGRFPYTPERLRMVRGRIVVEGSMGAWPATVELGPADALAVIRLVFRPIASAAGVAAALIVLRRVRS